MRGAERGSWTCSAESETQVLMMRYGHSHNAPYCRESGNEGHRREDRHSLRRRSVSRVSHLRGSLDALLPLETPRVPWERNLDKWGRIEDEAIAEPVLVFSCARRPPATPGGDPPLAKLRSNITAMQAGDPLGLSRSRIHKL